MNKTKIDWADMTWNPVSGCLHGCEYCYARKIARRFGGFLCEENKDWRLLQGGNIAELEGMQAKEQKDGKINPAPYPFGFKPTFHRYRLDEPQHIKKPQNIFVCSMADLFGDWVPDEWIRAVFKACEDAPQHRYLFLTKNPERYNKVYVPTMTNDFYMGASATNQGQLDVLSIVMRQTNVMIKTFVSIEPILEPINLTTPQYYSWIIVGAETGNRKAKIIPQKKWIDSIVRRCEWWNVPLFMKESLRTLMGDDFRQEYPWR